MGLGSAECCRSLFTKSNIQKSSYANHLEMLGVVERRPPSSGEPTSVDWDSEELSALFGRDPNVPALVELDAKFCDMKFDLLTWLVVEYCTSPQSNLGCAANALSNRKVAVIRAAEREKGLLDETIALIRSHIERACRLGVRVLVWSSTPRAGGCLWQFVKRQRDGYDLYLKKIWGAQRKLWKGFEALVRPLIDLPDDCYSPFLAVEWPKTCQYWHWKATKKTEKNHHRVILTAIVHGCSVGMVGKDGLPVKKQWRIDADLEALKVELSSFVCDGHHEHSSEFDLKETQQYLLERCKRLLRSLP